MSLIECSRNEYAHGCCKVRENMNSYKREPAAIFKRRRRHSFAFFFIKATVEVDGPQLLNFERVQNCQILCILEETGAYTGETG